jgi:hypothetical protein
MKLPLVVVVPLLDVDFLGRRRSLMIGICLQMPTFIFPAGYLGGTIGISASAIAPSTVLSKVSYEIIVTKYLHALDWPIG